MTTNHEDWTAVADLTGNGKLHGSQGPAPTIPEMTTAFQEGIDDLLRLSTQDDLVGTTADNVIATLLTRVTETEKALMLICEKAVVDWDNETVGQVDAVVNEPQRYRDWLKAIMTRAMRP